MRDDQYRMLVRTGLAPFVEDAPEGPDWEDLVTGNVSVTAPPPKKAPAWAVGLAVSAVVLVSLVLVVLLPPAAPPDASDPSATSPATTVGTFDGDEGAIVLEAWWSLVIAGDRDGAAGMSHPHAEFAFNGLAVLASSLGEDVHVSTEQEVFGTEQQPLLCYTLSGTDGDHSGAASFRQDAGAWLIWEIRPETVRCQGDFSPTTLPSAEFGQPPTLETATDSVLFFSTARRLTVVDVDAGSVVVHDVPALAPGDPPYRLVRRGGKLVFYGQTAEGPAAFAFDPSTPSSPIMIDEAWFFIPSPVEDRVWLAILDESSPSTERALQSVREVTVDGLVTVDDIRPPDGRWPVGAVNDGLLFQGDQALEVWDVEAREFTAILPGLFPVATWQNRIVSCIECDGLELIDLDTDTRLTLDLPPDVAYVASYGGAFAPDGRYVAVPGFLTSEESATETAGVGVVLVDFETGNASLVPGMSHAQKAYPQLAWSPDGEWLFYSVGAFYAETGQLFAFHPGDPTAYSVPVVLDGQYYGMAAD